MYDRIREVSEVKTREEKLKRDHRASPTHSTRESEGRLELVGELLDCRRRRFVRTSYRERTPGRRARRERKGREGSGRKSGKAALDFESKPDQARFLGHRAPTFRICCTRRFALSLHSTTDGSRLSHFAHGTDHCRRSTGEEQSGHIRKH
jgi:hypothetical protein